MDPEKAKESKKPNEPTKRARESSHSRDQSEKPRKSLRKHEHRKDVSSDLYKIEIRHLKFAHHSNVKEMLKKKLGAIEPVKIKVSNKRHKKGVAYVCFSSEEDKKKAKQMLQKDPMYQGKELTVKDAKPYDHSSHKRREDEGKDVQPKHEPKTVVEATAAYAHLSYDEQLKKKEKDCLRYLKKYANQLTKPGVEISSYIRNAQKENNGLPCKWLGFQPSPEIYGYRNKVEFAIGFNANGEKEVGFRLEKYGKSILVSGPDDVPHIPDIAKRAAKVFRKYILLSKHDVYHVEEQVGVFKQLTVRYSKKFNELMLIVGIISSELKTKSKEVRDELKMWPKVKVPSDAELKNCEDLKKLLIISDSSDDLKSASDKVEPDESEKSSSDQKDPNESDELKSSSDKTDLDESDELRSSSGNKDSDDSVDSDSSAGNDEYEELKASLRYYFQYGEGKELNVTSLYFDLQDKREKNDPPSRGIYIYGKRQIHEEILGFKFRISPMSFFQVNIGAAEILFQMVKDLAKVDQQTEVFDLCCGTGTIGILFSRDCKKVHGVEINQSAIVDAFENGVNNGVNNYAYHWANVEEKLPHFLERVKKQYKVFAIMDPPRAGMPTKCKPTIRNALRIERFIYIACSPRSTLNDWIDFSRNTSKRLKGDQFILKAAAGVDMFPHTEHLEMVLLFERIKRPPKPKTLQATKSTQYEYIPKPSTSSKITSSSSSD